MMKQTANAYRVPLWEPVAFLPCQMPDRSGRAQCPELRLVAAMLEDALQSVFRNASTAYGPRRREFLEACDWLWDDTRNWPFAFPNVCDLLGLDATAVRQCVRLMIATQRSGADDAQEKKTPQRPVEPRSWKRSGVAVHRPDRDSAADRERFEVVMWDEV